jgi:hypothetical protein
MNYAVMYEYAVDKNSGQFKAPFNQIHNEARVFTYEDTAIIAPNSDTPYSLPWMDLRAAGRRQHVRLQAAAGREAGRFPEGRRREMMRARCKPFVLGAAAAALFAADVAPDAPLGVRLVPQAHAIIGMPLTPLAASRRRRAGPRARRPQVKEAS